jgi:DNA-binding transcriptional ArsR family regulator
VADIRWLAQPARRSTLWLTIVPLSSILNLMVEDLELDTVFHALAHTARRDMLCRLAGQEQTVGQLAAPLTMSLAAASKHVKVLELAGLVDRQVRGREHVCRLAPGPLAAISEWLSFYEQFWNERLDNLDAMLRTARLNDDEERS